MLFNSAIFLFAFLPLALLLYFAASRLRLTQVAQAALVTASLVFYSYWDPKYLILILFSILFNYSFGIILYKRTSKGLLAVGVTLNLMLLGYFKYAAFFVKNLNSAAGTEFDVPHIILPLAISFFTFQQIAYLVDSYRHLTKEYNFLSYCLFVCFFPQLIAGPIVHHKEIIPQFSRLRTYVFSHANFNRGLLIFFLGLFKKLIIADTLAGWATPGFDLATRLTFLEAWGTLLSYTFQIYFDFSAYSEMAIGLGWMFNVKLPVNFNSPYKANSIVDFWRRWHITLSTFLRDYLYIPLGGNRQGKGRRYVNLMITMLLGGLWHGAGWTFVVWGGLHGLYLMIDHGMKSLGVKIHWTICRVTTFLAVILAWDFFRALTFNDAVKVLRGMVGLEGIRFGSLTYFPGRYLELVALPVLFLVVNFAPNTLEIADKLKPTWRWALFIALLAVICIANLNRVSEFIYFQF